MSGGGEGGLTPYVDCELLLPPPLPAASPVPLHPFTPTRCRPPPAATISVITNDGRHIVGTLRGYDQATNLILDECHERVYREDAGVETIVLGLYVVRGDNM